MDHGRHLENRYDVITPLANGPISTKFGSQMQNDMPMTTQRWKSKPEVEFQNGVHLFSEAGSSNISAVDWNISPKFGLQVAPDFPKWAKLRKNETGTKIAMRWPPSWKIDMTS